MDLCDIMLLGCGVDDDLLEEILETIAFIEEEPQHEHANLHDDSIDEHSDPTADNGPSESA